MKPRTGRVYIVGAGPGDPELLTLKAWRVLGDADVVVYDRLVSQEIIDLVPCGVSRIFAGKAPGNHALSQPQINQMLVRLARAGHVVVRLKGGDPFVFGRGGEEALALADAGCDFEVVPGLTAACACSAYAGIPLTHRDVARSVHFMTGHCKAGAPFEVDWQALASPQTTVVVYMGLINVRELERGLIAAGRAAATPVALIERGTTPEQRTLQTTLDRLSATVAAERVSAPCLIVVGEVVALADVLAWYASDDDDESHGVARSFARASRHG